MALINCPNCGKEISDKATACIHCGERLIEEVQPAIPQPTSRVSVENGTPPPNYIWLSVINIFLGGIIFGLIMLMMSLQVKPMWAKGNEDGARKQSKAVLILNLVFIFLSIIIYTWVILANI